MNEISDPKKDTSPEVSKDIVSKEDIEKIQNELIYSIARYDVESVRNLLENGASPCILDKKGNLPIHYLESINEFGDRLYHKEHLAIKNLLLWYGSYIDQEPVNLRGYTMGFFQEHRTLFEIAPQLPPFSESNRKISKRCFRLLVQGGIEFKIPASGRRSSDGKTAFHLAYLHQNTGLLIRILQENRINLTLKDHNGISAYFLGDSYADPRVRCLTNYVALGNCFSKLPKLDQLKTIKSTVEPSTMAPKTENSKTDNVDSMQDLEFSKNCLEKFLKYKDSLHNKEKLNYIFYLTKTCLAQIDSVFYNPSLAIELLDFIKRLDPSYESSKISEMLYTLLCDSSTDLVLPNTKLNKTKDFASLEDLMEEDDAKETFEIEIDPKEKSAKKKVEMEIDPKDAIAKETVAMEIDPKEAIEKETVAMEIDPKEAIEKETVPMKIDPKGMGAKEIGTKETCTKDTENKVMADIADAKLELMLGHLLNSPESFQKQQPFSRLASQYALGDADSNSHKELEGTTGCNPATILILLKTIKKYKKLYQHEMQSHGITKNKF